MKTTQNYQFAWGEADSMFILEATMKSHMLGRYVIATEPDNFLITCRNRNAKAYYRKSDIDKAKKIGEKLLEKKIVKHYFSGCKKIETAWLNLKKEIDDVELTHLTDRGILKYLKQYCNQLTLILAYYQVTTVPEYLEIAEKRIVELSGDSTTRNSLIRLASLNEAEAQEIALLELSMRGRIGERVLLNFVERFPDVAWNTYKKSEVVQYVVERIKQLNKITRKNRSHRIRIILSEKKELQKIQSNLYRRYASKELMDIANMIQGMGYWRFLLKKYWAGAEYWFDKLLHEIAKRMNVDFSTFMWVYSYEDVEAIFLKKNILSRRDVAVRKKSYTYLLDDGKLLLLTGKKEATFLKEHIHVDRRVTELQGNIANKGYIKGKVKIIHVGDLRQLKKDIRQFEDGDVLVTTMTQINIVNMMKRSGAILTEQGGIVCHAAIIAREINKPCIIGIKNLTTSLKDGDIVEVDANAGIIKILKC